MRANHHEDDPVHEIGTTFDSQLIHTALPLTKSVSLHHQYYHLATKQNREGSRRDACLAHRRHHSVILPCIQLYMSCPIAGHRTSKREWSQIGIRLESTVRTLQPRDCSLSMVIKMNVCEVIAPYNNFYNGSAWFECHSGHVPGMPPVD